MNRPFTLCLMCFILLIASCEQEVINTVDGNSPPDDPTVSYNTRNQYIEKVYITLLGRKPNQEESAAARVLIDVNPRDSAIRYQWIGDLLTRRSAFVKRWDDVRSELLESTDTVEIVQIITNLTFLMQSAPPDQKPLFQAEIDRMERINNVVDSLFAGKYSNIELHQYAVDNALYDDINMGTENFVVSVFDHFLYRYPTQFELTSSTQMVDGFQDLLFLESGQNKSDFIRIFFSSSSYAEGQVRYVYLNYLFREPTSLETEREKNRFIVDQNFQELQRRLLSTDEYFFQ